MQPVRPMTKLEIVIAIKGKYQGEFDVIKHCQNVNQVSENMMSNYNCM